MALPDENVEALIALAHTDEFFEIEAAKALLNKLNVKELRVLMAHYCGGAPSDFSDMRKQDLVDEIAPVYAAEAFA